MQTFMRLSLFSLIAVLAGCGASSGPIKLYDESEIQNTSNIAIIYLPPEIELIEADGQELDTPYIETGYNEVHLLPGKHVLAVKYVKFWGDEISGSMVRSGPVLFNIQIKGRERLYMNFDRPKDHWSAQGMAKRFQPWLEDKAGKKRDIKGSQFYSGSLTLPNSAAGSNKAMSAKEPLSELKFWWDKASYDEKEAFKKWLDED